MEQTYLDQLQRNVEAVRERMETAAVQSGRKPEEIILCAACKTRTIEEIMISSQLKIDCFGENHAQELEINSNSDAYKGKPAHFIGHLQTNKVKKVVGRAEIIQSADSERLIDVINTTAASKNLRQKILIEVNIGGEVNKTGVAYDEAQKLLSYAASKEHLIIAGLMTIPPVCESEDTARRFFSKIKILFDKLQSYNGGNIQFNILSMGMSADYAAAILEGSTMVRVGSAIFGPRNYNKVI